MMEKSAGAFNWQYKSLKQIDIVLKMVNFAQYSISSFSLNTNLAYRYTKVKSDEIL